MIGLWILGIAIALLLAPAVIGRFLAEDYHGRVERVVPASPAEVWRALRDPGRVPVAGKQCKATRPLPAEGDGALGAWVEDLGSSEVTVRTVEVREPERYALELTDSVVPMTARVEVTLAPEGSGTRVAALMHIRVRSGSWHVPYFRFILTLAGGARRSIGGYLDALERALN